MKILLVTAVPDSILDLPESDRLTCLDVAVAAGYSDNPNDIITFLKLRERNYTLGQVLLALGYLKTGKRLVSIKENKAVQKEVANAIWFVNKYSDFPRDKVMREVNRIAAWFTENNMKPYRDNVDKLLQRALFLQHNKNSFKTDKCVSCSGQRYTLKFIEGEEVLEPCSTCALDSGVPDLI
jgi:hypothetical protein